MNAISELMTHRVFRLLFAATSLHLPYAVFYRSLNSSSMLLGWTMASTTYQVHAPGAHPV
jgi:hypothetical protein